jgi:hypothetical protein
MSGSRCAPFGPRGEEVIDALESVTFGQLDEGLDACACPFAGQRRECSECSERQLHVGERESALDREPARPLRRGAWVGVKLRC